MLKLERLELSGFKSFVDPVTVHFAGGITAIVGPNGCGKSNLSDGMSWVLGEQSAKTLRGGTMEDVIFNGSDSRRPLGLAEATLVLRTPVDLPEAVEGRISISRRVFRTGESQYRLNGRTVRLKEIKDLLMDTGLGIRAYSVIEQGKIGLILSSKPQERRKLLEEAAGITRYKARKRVAEVKLEEALANLLRLDDVIAEIDRALRTLKRQASAAKRWQEKQAEIEALLARVLASRWAALREQLVALDQQLAEANSEDAELSAALSRDEASLAVGREQLDRQSEALAACHQRRAQLATLIEGRQEFLKSSRHTLQELGERLAGGRSLAERRDQDCAAHRERLAEQEAKQAELVAERQRAADAVEEDRQLILRFETELRQAESRVSSLRNEVLAAESALAGIQQRIHQGQIEQERANSRRHLLAQEAESRAAELEQSGEAMALARDRGAELAAAQQTKTAEHSRVSRKLEEILALEAQAADHKQQVRDELARAVQRRDVLHQLAAAQVEQRASFDQALSAAGLERPRWLAEELSAVEGWEEALDFYLGALTDAVILPEDEAAATLGRWLAGRVKGAAGATLLRPVAAGSTAAEAASPPEVDDPAAMLTLAQALGLPPELGRALPPAWLVEHAADAERLARRHPGIAFLSREGPWATAGLLHVEGDRAMPGHLARESELAHLEAALPTIERRLGEADRTIDELVSRRAEAAREKNRLEAELGQLRQDAAVAQARLLDLGARHERMAKGHQELAAQLETLTSQVGRQAERLRQLDEERELAEAQRASLAAALERERLEAEAAKNQRESTRTESAGRRGRLDVIQERLDTVVSELERLARELAESERQAAAWRDESARLDRRRGELEAARESAATELQQALEGQEAADLQVILEQEKLDDLRTDLRTLEDRIAACRERREEARSRVESLRVRQATLGGEREHLAQAYREQLGDEPPETAALDPAELGELEAELATSKATLERLGPVNLLAVEEHQEQEERFTFLTSQRADVAGSVTSLRQTIREINQTSSERFLATFSEVNKTFGEVFQHLFRGGEAEMHLLDEEDVLESGIEIVARPPGKRLQNIQLMSGGEKALTAIALLFALFRTKPSPFCVLDEVDAPLDDANTLRFVELLRAMASDTQFLVITHNKLTMEVASTLYGVTMEERGVSKLVSVEMEDVHPRDARVTA